MNDIVTPCHGAELGIDTRYDSLGPGQGQDIPDEIYCWADGCYNAWKPNGKAARGE